MKRILMLVCTVFILAGCAPGSTTPRINPMGTATAFPSPTILPSFTTTSTKARTATPTRTLFPPALGGTPRTIPASVITTQNADRVVELARWDWAGVYLDKLIYASGGRLLVSLEECHLVERDNVSGTVVRTISVSSQCFGDMAASPDGKILASVGSDPRWDNDTIIRLWDAETGKMLRAIGGSMAIRAAFSPDGKILATIIYDNVSIILWEVATGKKIRTIGCQSPIWIGGAVFLQDGQVVASVWCSLITLWDASTGKELRSFIGSGGDIGALASSRDGKLLATGSSDGKIHIWDAAAGKVLQTIDGQRDFWDGLAFSPDGTALASVAKDHTIRIWDTATGWRIHTLAGHTDDVESLVFSPDGKILVSGSKDTSAKVWDAAAGRLLHTLNGHTGTVDCIAFSPDGKTLATGSFDQTVKVWDSETWKERLTFQGHASRVTNVAFSPDGKIIASASEAGKIKLWETATGEELFTLRDEEDSVLSLYFSPDGKRLSVAADDTIEVWDTVLGKQISGLAWNNMLSFVNLAFSPDGTALASASTDGRISVWDPSTGMKLSTLPLGTDWGNKIAYSPDGKTLFSSWGYTYRYGSTWMWDIAAGQKFRTYTGGIFALSPDGKILAVAIYDDSIKLWDIEKGVELQSLDGHKDRVADIAFSPDGKTLASASSDGTIRIWGLAP